MALEVKGINVPTVVQVAAGVVDLAFGKNPK